jgi:NAD(P)-dependent dehydrogenase (short-subunit alcohol dehydrogenase family)
VDRDGVDRDAVGMHEVAGKVIVVTGSGRGVGLGIARHLGRGGARVVVAEWNPELLEAAVAELESLGVEALGVPTNIMERDEIEAMVAATVERFGRVDGLVNNAQTFRPLAPIAEVSGDDVDVFYRSGVKGTLWAMQALGSYSRPRHGPDASSAGDATSAGVRRLRRSPSARATCAPGEHPRLCQQARGFGNSSKACSGSSSSGEPRRTAQPKTGLPRRHGPHHTRLLSRHAAAVRQKRVRPFEPNHDLPPVLSRFECLSGKT